MEQQYHLISHALCPYVQRSIIAMEEKGIAYTRTNINLASKPDWFQEISPTGKVPILIVNNDDVLFESAVICEYLDEVTPNSLHSGDSMEKAYHRAWIEFGSTILNGIGGLYNAKHKNDFEIAHENIQQKFQLVEKEINRKPFFSGKQFKMIDAVYAPIFRYFDVFDSIVDLKIFEHLPKVQQWREVLRDRKSVQSAVVEEYPELLVQFIEKRSSYLSTLVL